MTMIDPQALKGAPIIGSDGTELGNVEDVYFDNETGRPEWAAIKTGLFGRKLALVPLATAQQSREGLSVPFDKATVKDAPHHDPDGELSTAEEEELFRYYGVPYGGETATALSGQAPASAPTGTSGTTNDAGDAMTRSEEEISAGKVRQEAGRVRLRKWVETEPVEFNVPVEREVAHVEREPITDANRDDAMSGPELRESTHEEIVYEEHVEPEKRVVPKERVRIEKERSVGEERVSDEIAKEQIAVEKDD